MCLRANRGEYQHTVCHECHEKHSKAQKRSRGCILSEDELIKSCHHELLNLQICADMWWCTRDHFGGPEWFDCPKGCAFCERMFNVGDTEWGCFVSRKFLVWWQKDRDLVRFFSPWIDDGGWSVVLCWLCGVNVVVIQYWEANSWRDFNRL